MDSGDCDKQKENSDPLPGTVPILQSIRIRCSFRIGNEMDREFLGYGYNILWYCGIISWTLFLFF